MGLITAILFMTIAIVVGLWLLRVLVFGIGVGIMLAVLSLTVVMFAATGLGGTFAFLLYFLIKLFMFLFVIGLIVGIITWVKDALFANC